MGLSIHYKGRIADPSHIGELRTDLRGFARQRGWELLDLTGQDESAILEIFAYPPGQSEPMSFFVDSDGRLHSPFEEAAGGDESAWCSVKTQYAPVEAHIQIVELLKQIHHDYIPDLEVVDEGGYWETDDLASLESAREFAARQNGLLLDCDEVDPVESGAEDAFLLTL